MQPACVSFQLVWPWYVDALKGLFVVHNHVLRSNNGRDSERSESTHDPRKNLKSAIRQHRTIQRERVFVFQVGKVFFF
jgi:hypothetical protein